MKLLFPSSKDRAAQVAGVASRLLKDEGMKAALKGMQSTTCQWASADAADCLDACQLTIRRTKIWQTTQAPGLPGSLQAANTSGRLLQANNPS